jgi:hypothetical protein
MTSCERGLVADRGGRGDHGGDHVDGVVVSDLGEAVG